MTTAIDRLTFRRSAAEPQSQHGGRHDGFFGGDKAAAHSGDPMFPNNNADNF